MKTVVTISRHWNKPQITTILTDDTISLKMDIADFITALKDEIGEVSYKPVNKSDLSKAIIDLIGKVTWKISQANFEVQVKEIINNVMQDKTEFDRKLEVAVYSIIQKVKEESAKVV